jgi:hypothetical protein
MKLIIAGGRNYRISNIDIAALNRIPNVTEVVSGGCRGADKDGERWAKENKISIKVFNADWKAFGKKAGPIRNRLMAQYADALALFPGGAGTQNMYNEARIANLIILDLRKSS